MPSFCRTEAWSERLTLAVDAFFRGSHSTPLLLPWLWESDYGVGGSWFRPLPALCTWAHNINPITTCIPHPPRKQMCIHACLKGFVATFIKCLPWMWIFGLKDYVLINISRRTMSGTCWHRISGILTWCCTLYEWWHAEVCCFSWGSDMAFEGNSDESSYWHVATGLTHLHKKAGDKGYPPDGSKLKFQRSIGNNPFEEESQHHQIIPDVLVDDYQGSPCYNSPIA